MAFANACTEIEESGGRGRATVAIKPVAYLSDGNYRRITNVLGATGDPSMTLGVNELAQFRLRPKLAGQSPVLHFGKGQSHVRWTPLGTNNVDGYQVGENGFRYDNAWDNADLQVQITGHRLYKSVFLRAGHPSTFSFRLDEHSGFDPETLKFGSDFFMLQPSLDDPATGESIPLTWVVTQSSGKYILTCTLPPGNHAGRVLDPSYSVQPDATAGKDTHIASTAPTNNRGVYGTLMNTMPGIIKFDLSSIPSSATCVSAVMTPYQVSSGPAGASSCTVYSIAVGNADWIEGTKANTLAGAGEPCWNARQADGAGGVLAPWAGSAGLSTAGTDYEAAAMGSVAFDRSDPDGTPYAITLNAVRVQGWFGVISTNYGMKLVPTGNVGGLGSSDHATAAYRPSLSVTYKLPSAGLFRHGGMWK